MTVMERHLAITWGVDGFPVAHYRAESIAAEVFAAYAVRQHLLQEVTVDDEVTPEMPELPYQHLFTP